jgi:hypoxanthine-DNA glycosylase
VLHVNLISRFRKVIIDRKAKKAKLTHRRRLIGLMETIIHTIDPVFDMNSKVLILGTMPSVKSREQGFFYMHPRNIFWRLLSDLLKVECPESIGGRKEMLLENRIAVWDVLKSCEIEGSLDSTIRNPVPNDIAGLISRTGIRAVFTTGRTAAALYRRYCSKDTGLDGIYLPSTSPANNNITYEKKLSEWRKILDYIKGE